jgi:hypothetical protein
LNPAHFHAAHQGQPGNFDFSGKMGVGNIQRTWRLEGEAQPAAGEARRRALLCPAAFATQLLLLVGCARLDLFGVSCFDGCYHT